MSIKIYVLMLCFFYFESAFAIDKKCMSDDNVGSKRVRITSEKDPEKGQRYISYSISNRTSLMIKSFVIGYGELNDKIQIFEANIPRIVEHPKGWKGVHVFPEEGMYMHLFWQALNEKNYIKEK